MKIRPTKKYIYVFLSIFAAILLAYYFRNTNQPIKSTTSPILVDVIHNLKTNIQDEVFLSKIDNENIQKDILNYTNENILSLSRTQLEAEHKRTQKVLQYWGGVAPTIWEMVLSDDKLINADQNSTTRLITRLVSYNMLTQGSVVEFAAGVGRITESVMVKLFRQVDVVEPIVTLVQKVTELKEKYKNIRDVTASSGENFVFSRKYELIFGQWFLENMSDIDVIKFLLKAKKALARNGKMLFKENINTKNFNQITESNAQKVRVLKVYLLFFKLAGLRPIYIKIVDDYPMMYHPCYEFVLEVDN